MSIEVVGLGAWCDLVPREEDSASPGGASFGIHEFADLADGRRVTLHSERGFHDMGACDRAVAAARPLDLPHCRNA